MRIGLNLLPVVPGIGGSWHYIANLLTALAEYDRENEYWMFVTKVSVPVAPVRDNFHAVMVPLRAKSRTLRIAFENTVLPSLSRGRRLDCMHHFFGTLPLFGAEPTVVSIFDLMAFDRPQDFPAIKGMYLRAMRRHASKHATVLAPMSATTSAALRDSLNVREDRMVVVPTAISSRFRRCNEAEIAQFRARYGLAGDFWLCVSSSLPHKNLGRLVESFARLRQRSTRNWQLIVRGESSEPITTQIAAHGIGRRVRFLPPLSDDEMPLLYSSASALIFPSLYEGGGIPVMEAMACGCPVVASNLPTTREFAWGTALTFDPYDVDDIVRAMEQCEHSGSLRSEMAREGLKRAVAFDPAVVAATCLRAYLRAAATRRGDALPL